MEEKLALLPDKPGVYLMKDDKGRIIYVGKAINLKNRVRSYFQSSRNHSPKVLAMVARIADLEYIITASEIEALILECNLIKKHRPKYNISLRDDKTYPYIKVTAEEYPRVYATRKVVKDGARYFGPYTSAGAVHETLRLLKTLFPLRSCRRLDAKRPCLEHHIKRCLAPCSGKVDQDAYREMIKAVELFLEGRSDTVVKNLRRLMAEAAEALEFEQAARLRDQLTAVEKIIEKQNIVTGSGDQDAIGLARSAAGTCAQVFFIRSGKMVGRDHFMLSGGEDETDQNMLTAFIKQYYSQAAFIPREILLPLALEEQQLLAEWLSGSKGGRVQVETPKRGTKKDLVNMAAGNAAIVLQEQAARLAADQEKTAGAAAELGQHLGLTVPPERIECFDISHIQGSETVASMVVFEGGQPNKNEYRRYKLKTVEGKPDDFKSMQEVVGRRYRDALAKGPVPDLIIIDGGKGQLNAALPVIRAAGLQAVMVVGLAKEFEHIFKEGISEPLILPRHSQSLYLVQRIRDEAHRFAITYHRKLRSKRNLVSVLDHIPGIGAKRRQALWHHFGSLAKIKAAEVAELAKVEGMTLPAAEAVYNFFRNKNL
ncbi:excinuclease ABC subunit UvrC [Sporomusa acidovorans]|uniref:UvrABC system protein C n=1 Tax=Sporomusa acidovorans (strain ATCC 49682 / DSM 3132 / Mol) TaxID=1123286 RepID=A0ABZ3J821_SPOA4|nr:UvrABC system protein C [Sporomusa acidovorans DSM 3132]SDF27261.1 Excinuclease ABC subunit C [Sporomusa acidovorans]